MKIILEFDGNDREFSNAIGSIDDQFDLIDSLLYELDYEPIGTTGIHHTSYGDIKITVIE